MQLFVRLIEDDGYFSQKQLIIIIWKTASRSLNIPQFNGHSSERLKSLVKVSVKLGWGGRMTPIFYGLYE
jgi:hypothetical protein